MLGTDKELIELKLANDWKSAKNTVIDRLIRTFGQHPNHFFTEHDIHSVLYSIAREELQLNGVLTVKTRDRYEIALVNHESPTPFRCSMKGYRFEIKHKKPYRRGHYDLIILNPEFVENTKREVVYGKDYQRFTSAMHNVTVEPLIWACEVIFLPGVKTLPKNAPKIIEQDALKVKATLRHIVGRNVRFCKMGSVLVFTSHTAEEALELKQQIVRLSQKHKLEVTLSAPLPKENQKVKKRLTCARSTNQAYAIHRSDYPNMLQITEKHLEKLRRIKQHFHSGTEVPKKNKWQSLTNNDIWLHIFAQVMVVGGSEPYKKFDKRVDLKHKVTFDSLIELEDDREVKKKVNQVMRAVGTRYASSDISKCRKTDALAHNLKMLKSLEGDPKGFLKELSRFSSDKRKIDYVMHSLKYIKNKGARDLLMELGLVRNAIAFDSRIKNVFHKIGIETPEHFETSSKLYDEVENAIISKICMPLGISGIELDRMMYQNYEGIMKMKL